MSEPEDAIWYVGIQGEQKGPFTPDAIREMIAKGEAGPQDMVWNEGMTEWQPISQTAEFTETAASAPAAEPKAPAGPNPAVEFLKKVLADVKTIAADPDEGLRQVADSKPLIFSATVMGFGVLAFGLLCLLIQQKAFPLGASGGAAFGRGILYSVMNYGIWFGLTLAAFAILKTKATWQDAVTVTGLSAIPMVITALAVFALGWLSPRLLVLFAFAIPAKVLLLTHLFVHLTQVSMRTALYAIPLLVLAVQVVFGLLVSAL